MNVAVRSIIDDSQMLELSRTYSASVEDVWALWTTKDGIEAWWGPEGFSVVVRELDVRPKGRLLYLMTATGVDQVAFMKSNGLSLSTESTITYTGVEAHRLIAFNNLIDFVPGHEAYDPATQVAFIQVGSETQVQMRFERMHDEVWTGRMLAGWESELNKLERLLSQRSSGTQT